MAIKVTAGRMVPSRFGHFSQSDMIGVPYGSKVRLVVDQQASDVLKGHFLSSRQRQAKASPISCDRHRSSGQLLFCPLPYTAPTICAFRTLALPHRTQILYLPDIASITSQLDIGPGSTVIEAGSSP